MERISANRIYWACECVERQAGDCDVLHLDDQEYYIADEADRYIAGLKNQIPRWRDVYEEPPEEGDLVIVRFEEQHPGNYFPKDIVRWNSSYILGEIKVTGWMPVPEGQENDMDITDFKTLCRVRYCTHSAWKMLIIWIPGIYGDFGWECTQCGKVLRGLIRLRNETFPVTWSCKRWRFDMSQRPVYENITSPYYERFFVPTACFGDKTRGILLYRETGSDEWVINYNATYYTAGLNAAKNNTSSGFQYLGMLDFDSLLVSCMANALMELKTTAKGGTECTEQA